MPFLFKKAVTVKSKKKTMAEKAKDWVTRRSFYPEISAGVQTVKSALFWPRPQFVPISVSFKQWLEALKEKGQGLATTKVRITDI